jgi:hypothetical protein
VDHQTSPQTQRNAWADICWPKEPWPWKGPQVPPHYWWFPPCSLEKAQYSPAPPLPLIHVIFVKFISNKQFRTVKKKKKRTKNIHYRSLSLDELSRSYPSIIGPLRYHSDPSWRQWVVLEDQAPFSVFLLAVVHLSFSFPPLLSGILHGWDLRLVACRRTGRRL